VASQFLGGWHEMLELIAESGQAAVEVEAGKVDLIIDQISRNIEVGTGTIALEIDATKEG